MIPTVDIIEVKEANQKEHPVFKNIGQILKAYIQKKDFKGYLSYQIV